MHAFRPVMLLAALLVAAGCGDDPASDRGACGDGRVDGSEECDDGNAVDADGCDQTCRFSCVSSDSTRNCAPDDECAGQGTCDDQTHLCAAGEPLADDEPCAGGSSNYCLGGVCTAPVCGNGQVEPGEECDSEEGCTDGCQSICPGGPGCDAVCGDGVRQAGELCDDGNTTSLDGCDSACQFEQAARITSLQQQFATDDFCPQNALGTAVTPDGQPTIQLTWDAPVQDGTLSIVFKFLDLTDLSGESSTFRLGFVNARAGGRTPAESPTCGNAVCEEGAAPGSSETVVSCPDDCTYDGNNDLDWWYIRDPSSVDEDETPLVQLPGQIAKGALTAGPGTISLQLLFAFEPAQVTLFNAAIQGTLDGPIDAPAESEDGSPPGHLASENLAPDLTTFSTSSAGSMCSDVSAASLFGAPMPMLLQAVCTDEGGKNPAFTPSNRLLDAFVAGCRVFGAPGINPVQPDGSTDGSVYEFALDETSTVSSCTRDGEPAELADCVAAATFSSYFKFASGRVIIRRE